MTLSKKGRFCGAINLLMISSTGEDMNLAVVGVEITEIVPSLLSVHRMEHGEPHIVPVKPLMSVKCPGVSYVQTFNHKNYHISLGVSQSKALNANYLDVMPVSSFSFLLY
jgi:hypothetical protein